MATVVVTPSTTNLSSVSVAADDVLEVREGSQSIAGADKSASDLQDVYIREGFSGSFGTSSSAATLAVSNVSTATEPTLFLGHNGSAFIAAGGNNIDIARVTSGKNYLTGGTVATVYVSGGYLEIGASCVVTTLVVSGGTVVVQDNATAITTLRVSGGQVDCYRDVTTVSHSDGNLVARDAFAATTYNLSGPAVLRHRSTGTIATLNIEGDATYDPSGSLANTALTTVNINSSRAKYVQASGTVRAVAGTLNNNANATLYNGTFAPGLEP